MSAAEMKIMEAEFLAAIPDQADLAGLNTDDTEVITNKVMAAAAAVMADKPMAEPMPGAADQWLTISPSPSPRHAPLSAPFPISGLLSYFFSANVIQDVSPIPNPRSPIPTL